MAVIQILAEEPQEISSSLEPTTRLNIDVEAVLAKVDLVTLVLEAGVDLIPQTNGDYIGFCPFHGDVATPSFRLYSQTNTWHCFGCQKGSSVFDFVMYLENISFREALIRLAELVGYDTNAFSFRDIRVSPQKNQFNKVRNEIEFLTLTAMQELHRRYIQFVTKSELYYILDNYWKWYDAQQDTFSQYILANAVSPDVMLMYDAYKTFLEQIDVIKDKCTHLMQG